MKKETIDLLSEHEWSLYGYMRNTEPYATEMKSEKMAAMAVSMRLVNQAYNEYIKTREMYDDSAACIRKVSKFISAIAKGKITLE